MEFYTGFINADDKPYGPGVKTIYKLQLKDCYGPEMTLPHNPDGPLNADQERYEGQFKDGEMHGQGHYVYSSGN